MELLVLGWFIFSVMMVDMLEDCWEFLRLGGVVLGMT